MLILAYASCFEKCLLNKHHHGHVVVQLYRKFTVNTLMTRLIGL